MKADLRITSSRKCKGAEAISILVTSKASIGEFSILFN
jgi:hypothetical protein